MPPTLDTSVDAKIPAAPLASEGGAYVIAGGKLIREAAEPAAAEAPAEIAARIPADPEKEA